MGPCPLRDRVKSSHFFSRRNAFLLAQTTHPPTLDEMWKKNVFFNDKFDYIWKVCASYM